MTLIAGFMQDERGDVGRYARIDKAKLVPFTSLRQPNQPTNPERRGPK